MNRETFISNLKLGRNAPENISMVRFERTDFKSNIDFSDEQLSNIYLYILTFFACKLNNKWKDSVKFHIEGRQKSISSIETKTKKIIEQVKKGERNFFQINDILGVTIIADRVEEDFTVRGKMSDNVIIEMFRRSEYIDLLGNLINYFNEQYEIGNFFSSYDKSKTSHGSVEILNEAFNADFADNIQRYRPGIDIKKDIPKINLNEAVLYILKEKLDLYVAQLRNLEEKGSTERRTLLEDTMRRYNDAIKKLEEKSSQQWNDQNFQEEYYKYMIILLDRLQMIEYKECYDDFKEINQAFDRNINVFISKLLCENGEYFNANVSLENLQKLEQFSRILNAQMSDKLQQAILLDSAKELYLRLPYINAFIPRHSIDEKRFKNGYVSDHFDINIEIGNGKLKKSITEGHFKTHYRDIVSSVGNASHAGTSIQGRGRKEKDRPWELLPIRDENDNNKFRFQYNLIEKIPEDFITDKPYYQNWLSNLQAPPTQIPQFFIKNTEVYNKWLEEQNEKNTYTPKSFKSNEVVYKKWMEDLKRVTPRYFTIEVNKGVVKCTIHNFLDNIKKYFGETNVRDKRNLLNNSIGVMSEFDLLGTISEQVIYFEITEFMQNNYRIREKVERFLKNQNLIIEENAAEH